MVKCKIITCNQWGAKPPKTGLELVGKSSRIIFHHTAGHHAEIENPNDESIAEAKRYARDIQAFHMGPQRRWNDTGQNFLVCRNGVILQGRHLTVSAIEARHMVMSAHCPGQNDQIGIEHEHMGSEPMTKKQIEASARLMAWIANQYGRKTVLPVYPHSKYYSTSCPANLKNDIAAIKRRAQHILDNER